MHGSSVLKRSVDAASPVSYLCEKAGPALERGVGEIECYQESR